jgi:hypothetical protein
MPLRSPPRLKVVGRHCALETGLFSMLHQGEHLGRTKLFVRTMKADADHIAEPWDG